MAIDNKDKKVLNVPPLRFPEFTEEWEKYKLSEICSFFSGGTPSSSKKEYYDGNIPFIRSGELHEEQTELFITEDGFKNSAAKMVEVGDLLLALYGATSGDIAISKINGAINQAILCIRTEQNKKFIESIWRKHVGKLLQTYLQGGQGNLSADIVKNISFYFSRIEEQNKLAEFVSLLDERIATQNKIIEDLKKLKSAIIEMEYTYKTKGNTHIGDFIEQTSKRNKDSAIQNVLSVSNSQGFIQQCEQFENRSVASDDISNYKIVERNCFAFNPARINVGSIARLTTFDRGIVSPMYICFRTKDNLFPEYLDYYFESKQFFTEIQKRLEGSVRQCLSYEGLCNIPLCIPTVEVQQQTGKRLSTLAQEIKLEIDFLELLQK
ncbi:restriction endonuclease subunit S [Bacteroides fragilis]